MPSPSELERLAGLGQLAELEALRVQVRDPSCPALPDLGPNHLWPEIQALTKELERLRRGEFTPEEIHNFCHNLHGTVDSQAFAQGCAHEQRRLYGCAPHVDEIAALTGRVHDLESQLATVTTLAADWQREATRLREMMDLAERVQFHLLEPRRTLDPDDGA